MENTSNQIFFNFSYFALKLLGKGLYSNAWTAIAELVANGFDAKASSVNILIDMSQKNASTVEIFDNGYGMGYEDLAKKYVLIGKNKRNDDTHDDETKSMLMGRKGIGKLATLYLSNRYFLLSKTEHESSAWCLDMTDVSDTDIPRLNRINENSISIAAGVEWDKIPTGTLIKLTNVDLTNIGFQTVEGLKARLADFYVLDQMNANINVAVRYTPRDKIEFYPVKKSIAFRNFYAFYNNITDFDPILSKRVYMSSKIEEIDKKGRDVIIFNTSDYPWTSGKRIFHREDGTPMDRELPYAMEGWIGIHSSIKKEDAIKNDNEYLKNKAYRPTQLRLYVRKKLAVENFMEYVRNTQAFANYIEGEISFDILDNDQLGDIATSNRQGFIEDDERVRLLVEILKPIIGALIRARANIGYQIRSEEDDYRKAEERRQEEARRDAEEAKEKAEREAENLATHLGNEKRRSSRLFHSLSQDQIEFEKKLHTVKIDLSTIKLIINKMNMQRRRGKFTTEAAWEGMKKISYFSERIKASLEYSGAASFNTKEESMTGDLFEFISDYCDSILMRISDIKISPFVEEGAEYIRSFSSRDIAVIMENLVSNSLKNDAKNMKVSMYKSDGSFCLDIMDDGNGLDKNIIDTEELFEFGKSYSKIGSGIGLYHVKNIITQMGGEIKIDSTCQTGFQISVRFYK